MTSPDVYSPGERQGERKRALGASISEEGQSMNRRKFLSAPVVTAAITASSALAQGTRRYDTVLKGGHVIDSSNGINQQMDVAVLDGKIARVDRNIPASAGEKTIDVSGYYVTSGLIDLHICCYYTRLDLTPSVIA